MKDYKGVFYGLSILGICIIVSSIIISNGLKELSDIDLRNSINGALHVTQPTMEPVIEGEYMAIGEISRLLGYNDIYDFSYDVRTNKLEDFPYIIINGKLIFSRTAFSKWLIEKANEQSFNINNHR
ncbi:MAG: hypothetical protein N4A63_14120 [Vallitalea sp.]|nr:hypothetical protein [Vallitalea sp.]